MLSSPDRARLSDPVYVIHQKKSLRLNHAALPWLPRDRDRIVMFYTYRPQFYFAPEAERMLERVHAEGIELDEATLDLISMREKAALKEVVKNHLASSEGS